MESLEYIFKNSPFVIARGGPYENNKNNNLALLQNKVILVGQELISHLKNESSIHPAVHIDFINNLEFRVCSFNVKEKYFIGLNVGLINILMRFFNSIMSNPKLLLNIGDASKEIETSIINDSEITHHNYLDLFTGYDTDIYFPIDRERLSYVFKLFFKAIEFLLMHEYGHIIMGHIDFKASNTKMIDNLTKQTLEMDADCYATKISFHRLVSIFEGEFNANNKLKFEDYLFDWYFSIYLMFRLFGQKKYDLESDHPVIGIRQYNVLKMLKTLLSTKAYSEYEKFSDMLENIFNEVALECEKSLNLISSKTFDTNPLSILATDEGYYQIYKVMNNWQYVRPELVPYAKVGLAPIQSWNESDFVKSPFNKN